MGRENFEEKKKKKRKGEVQLILQLFTESQNG